MADHVYMVLWDEVEALKAENARLRVTGQAVVDQWASSGYMSGMSEMAEQVEALKETIAHAQQEQTNP